MSILPTSPVMAGSRRVFTDEEKRSVLQQASIYGISNTLKKYSLSYSVFSKWKQKFGYESRGSQSVTKETYMVLLEENARLKKIITEMALLLEDK